MSPASPAPPPPRGAERFPTNRVIALLGPYIAVLAGTLAAWLSQHFPGLADDVDAETQSITQAITFAVGALISWALQHKYLDGWQRWEQACLAHVPGHTHGHPDAGAGAAAGGGAGVTGAGAEAGAGVAVTPVVPVELVAPTAPAPAAALAPVRFAQTPAPAAAPTPGGAEPFGGFDPSIFEDLIAPAGEPVLGDGRPSDG